MKKSVLSTAILGGVLAAAMYVVPANAQATRTWVSGVGDDVNPCSRTAPCKTFAGAISKTATNGEINCLDPAGYGALNIIKSITVDCGYTHGSVLAANTNGFIVNGAGVVVNLRGLSINGAGTTTGNGIRIINAGAVNIDNVVIENFGGAAPSNGRGVSIETAANVRVTIQNSRFANNNNIGVHSNPTGGTVGLTIYNTTFAPGGSTAIQLRQNTNAVIDRVTATGHLSGAGVTAELTTVNTVISNSNLSNNSFGIFNGNGGNPITRVYGSTISGNTTAGLNIVSGQVISSGNNIIRGNTGNEAPSSTPGMQ